MRQWDTKKQFKPRYGLVAKVVFLGIWIALSQGDWRCTFRQLGVVLWELVKDIGNVLLGVALLVLSPITFPLFCLVEAKQTRRRRLDYLRRERAADEDI